MQCSLSCNLTKQHFILFNAVLLKKELLILVSDIRGIKFHTGKDLLPSFRGINKLLLQQHPTLLFNIYPFKFVFLYSPNLILRHTHECYMPSFDCLARRNCKPFQNISFLNSFLDNWGLVRPPCHYYSRKTATDGCHNEQ